MVRPTAIAIELLITLLAFNLFHAFVLLNGSFYRQGKITLQELRLVLFRAVNTAGACRSLAGEPKDRL